jgi:hypothetical protein
VIRGLREPVRLTTRESLQIFDLADIWAARTGNTVRLVSANDHVHSRRSAHYAGVAVDLHTSDPAGLSAALKKHGYRVLWNVPGHRAHVHVEVESGFAPRTFPRPPVLRTLRQRGPDAETRPVQRGTLR